MGATGLAADPAEYRVRLLEQSDEQIDAWAMEAMRDISIRRGVLAVLRGFKSAAGVDDVGVERLFTAGGGPPAAVGQDAEGRLLVPAIALHCLVTGTRAAVPDARERLIDYLVESFEDSRTSEPAGPATPGFGSRRTRAAIRQAVGLVRIVHPFPTLLDAAATAALATVAGARPATAILLGGAMLLLQATIGIVNDLSDAPTDRIAKPGKPIPAGLVDARLARLLAIVAGAGGLGLAALAGLPALAVAIAGLGAGLAYDLRLKGTAWAWLPFSVGIPLLPLFAWLGAGAAISLPLLLLLPVAAEAGAQLAIANALADLERDRAAGIATVATRVGAVAAGRLAALHATLVAAGAVLSLVVFGGTGPGLLVAAAGVVTVAAGAAAGLRPGGRSRQAGWELQAIGVAILAGGWALALAAAGRL